MASIDKSLFGRRHRAGEGVKQKSETVQALERELTRHGLDLADVVDLFSHDAASEDEDEPTEASEERLPTPEFVRGVTTCALKTCRARAPYIKHAKKCLRPHYMRRHRPVI